MILEQMSTNQMSSDREPISIVWGKAQKKPGCYKDWVFLLNMRASS